MSIASTAPQIDEIDSLIDRLESLRGTLDQATERILADYGTLPAGRRRSAENLAHYMALRNFDLRPEQARLSRLGLSSLDQAESSVLATIDSVLRNLRLLKGEQATHAVLPAGGTSLDAGGGPLEENIVGLLGGYPEGRRTRIMVTMPAGAAEDYMMLDRLLNAGMDCIRINCAHDDSAAWLRIIHHVRDAEVATGRPCRILMDLGGPKLRTGQMELLPAVKKIRPVRDSFGHVLRKARIWLAASGSAGNEVEAADACLTVDSDWLAECRPGDRILLSDARDSKRRWRIREVSPDGCWAEAGKTTYVTNGTVLRLRGFEKETEVRDLPRLQSKVRVRVDDVVLIVNTDEPGKPALRDDNGELLSPGRVALPVPEIYRDTRRGETVCFDDGRVSGIIEKKNPNCLQVRITHTRRPLESLAADKGVNFPDSQLGLPALGEKDVEDLKFVVQHADLVGLSFANRPEDVLSLRRHLEKLGGTDLGVVLKIETRWGFANLPDLLLEAMKFKAAGVMIARGDLAVECGFERLAEVQQEILWVCEAAHLPVIWATQVLEGLARGGHPSRAEITDAAMSVAADCVMLNKGPYITSAVQTLDDVLKRMQHHQHKKLPLLRKLQLSEDFTARYR